MLRSLLFVLLIAFSGAAFADEFNYNSLTLSYGTIDIDNSSIDADSIGLDLSFALGESFLLVGGYSVAEDDLSTEITNWNGGIGYHYPITKTVDFVADVTYEYIDISVPLFGSVDDNGFGASAGLRANATEFIELNAFVNYIDMDLLGDDTAFSAAALFNLTDSFAVGVSGQWDDDVAVYSIGARFYFDDGGSRKRF